jgi:hypothetical protein
MQPPPLDPVVDRVRVEAALEELPPSNDTVLPSHHSSLDTFVTHGS